MKTFFNVTNKILVLLVLVLFLSCNNQSNKKYNACVKVLKEHIKTVENCTDCNKLEIYYRETGKANGWVQCQNFLSIFHPNVPGFETPTDVINWYECDISDGKANKLQVLHNDLKSAIEKKFVSLHCQSEVIRAYIGFHEELNASIAKCSNYYEYNSLVESVKNDINDLYENENNLPIFHKYVSLFALQRLVKASKNMTSEEEPIVTQIGQDYDNRIAPIVAKFKEDEQQEQLKKELFEKSSLREKLKWLEREGNTVQWEDLVNKNTIDYNDMVSDYNNPIKAEKKYKTGTDMILKVYVGEIHKTNGKYAYEITKGDHLYIYSNDSSFAELDYPHTVWIIAKYYNRDIRWGYAYYDYYFTDAELLAW